MPATRTWLALPLLVLPACGGRSEQVPAEPTGQHPSADFSLLHLERWQGFEEPCSVSPENFSLRPATAGLQWSGCVPGPTMQVGVSGSTTLFAGQMAALRVALSEVSVSHEQSCGADAGVVTLDVVTAAGTERYVDDFYSACPFAVHQGRTFATGLNELWSLGKSLWQ